MELMRFKVNVLQGIVVAERSNVIIVIVRHQLLSAMALMIVEIVQMRKIVNYHAQI